MQNVDVASLSAVEKNTFLYFWGMVVNAAVVAVVYPGFFAGDDAEHYTAAVKLSVALAAFGGFSTAMLLQLLSAIVKEFVNAAEMLVVALLSAYFLGTPLRGTLLVGAVLAGVALFLFKRPGADAKYQAVAADAEDEEEGAAKETELQARA